MIQFEYLQKKYEPYDYVGYIPYFLDENDPRPAAEQFHENYSSGWNPMRHWQIADNKIYSLAYPEDPVLSPVAKAVLHGKETIFLYDPAFVMILQEDGSFEVSYMD